MYIFLMLKCQNCICIELDSNYDSKSWNSNYCIRICKIQLGAYINEPKLKWTGKSYFYHYPYGQLA